MLERSAVLRNPEIASKKYWPWSLIVITVLWLVATVALIKVMDQKKQTGFNKVFQSKAASKQAMGLNQTSPALSASPTIYVPGAPQDTGDYEAVSFNLLSGFYFWDPLEDIENGTAERNKKKSKVPEKVLAYNGHKIAVTGFMIPVDEDEKFIVSTFVLAKNQMTCCYGASPRPNDWIYATVPPTAKKVEDEMDVPLTVYGTLTIDGALSDPSMPTLYRLVVDKVEGPKKKGWF
ncbi:MAG TPA: DUF3299 domain-containing protein [bacterium]|nr:DUF3299 domain-containing protein [bacterium]